MILAQELRVGNLATDEKFDNQIVELHTICRFDPNKAAVTEHDTGYYYECSLRDLNAITLTSEILLKSGFEKSSMTYDIDAKYSAHSFRILSVDLSAGIIAVREGKSIDSRHKDDVIIVHNKDYHGELFLHILQNIFFSFAKKELQINL